jgi:hypothetical protein
MKSANINMLNGEQIPVLINLNRFDADSERISLAILRPWECVQQVNSARYKVDGRKRHNGLEFSTPEDTLFRKYT